MSRIADVYLTAYPIYLLTPYIRLFRPNVCMNLSDASIGGRAAKQMVEVARKDI